MTTVISSAPGKAILSGEYVVLLGAPAISAAIDRRVTVTIKHGESEYHSVRSPGLYNDADFFVDPGNGVLQWRDAGAEQRFQLFESVWRCCSPFAAKNLEVQIDSRPCFDEKSGSKLGLGSSAAIACALTIGLSELAEGPQDVSALAHAAHRDFQKNSGSGVDVATSLAGGLVEFSIVSQSEPSELNRVDDLLMQFFWSGKATATTRQVRKFLGGDNDVRSNARTAELIDHAFRVAAAWRSRSAAEILTAMADYVPALAQFSDEFGLDVFAAGHDQMSALATESGIVYKPCGAGGGDIGVAMAIDEAQLQVFCNQAEKLNFELLNCDIDRCGASVETSS